MHNKKNKLICVLITLFVFISGMYFEDSKVDSVFGCTPTETTNYFISSVNTVISYAQACTTEMLGVRGNRELEQLTIRFANQRRDTKIFPDFLCQNNFSLNEGISYTSLEGMQLILKFQDELVKNFIHKSDGKKRI